VDEVEGPNRQSSRHKTSLIAERTRLSQLIKRQRTELQVLREERDRLRAKTFPSFVWNATTSARQQTAPRATTALLPPPTATSTVVPPLALPFTHIPAATASAAAPAHGTQSARTAAAFHPAPPTHGRKASGSGSGRTTPRSAAAGALPVPSVTQSARTVDYKQAGSSGSKPAAAARGAAGSQSARDNMQPSITKFPPVPSPRS
jgi:hypothetical protein